MTSHVANDVLAPSLLLESIERVDRAHPLARKRLVGPDVNFGRELLVTLARRTGGWIGWEATNLRGIAQELAFVPLAEHGVRVADDVAINALVGLALDQTIEAQPAGSSFAALAPGLGFRRALRDTILELRMAGISASDLRRVVTPGSPAHDLPVVFMAYERLLNERGLADAPEVFRVAIHAFEREAPFVLDGEIALALPRAPRGLPGELYALLIQRGAESLDVDTVQHDRVLAASVDASFFAAATPSDELREILRRVLAEGLRWDDVEIVATDPDAYGVALDSLCQRLGIGVTMLQGLPLARTRIGRTLERWLAWLDDGLSADVLRQALEAGELASRCGTITSTALARELRAMRIGWGRARFDAAVLRLTSGQRIAELRRHDDESVEEFARRRSGREQNIAALACLLESLLATTPAVPERGCTTPVRSSCATLARATLGYLALCSHHGEAESQTMSRLTARLGQLAKLDDDMTSFSTALAALREALSDLRAWPSITSERKPWSAAGSMPHLTTTSHAGTTGRPRVFVVGLDADRTSDAGRQDPLLPDAMRRALGDGRLITSTERREEGVHALAASLASLRGRVTMSYATSGTLDGREAGPSPLMLQAWRAAQHDDSQSYEQLRHALRPPVSAVPARNASGELVGVTPIDERDIWLDALADGPLLLDGTDIVREAFPVLAAGLDAHGHATGDELTQHHGLVPEAGAALDPARHEHREISPSSLETIAKCPLSWFYHYGLSLLPAHDPEYDEDRWLDQLQRGALLHEVFEAFTREYQGRQELLSGIDASRRMLACVLTAVAHWRDDVPPPSESVFESERDELHLAAAAFLQMERDRHAAGDGGRWHSFELAFGHGRTQGPFTLPNGRTILTHGRADRVDEMPDGTLRVIDYKTGKAKMFARSSRTGPFNGGRQLQPAIYQAAVQAVLARPVSSFEYRFPTARGGNEIVAYPAAELSGVPDIVASLLAHVDAGEFIPTTDASDCSFCNFQSVCRVERGKYGTQSPRADWAKSHAGEFPEYASMLARRTPGVDE